MKYKTSIRKKIGRWLSSSTSGFTETNSVPEPYWGPTTTETVSSCNSVNPISCSTGMVSITRVDCSAPSYSYAFGEIVQESSLPSCTNSSFTCNAANAGKTKVDQLLDTDGVLKLLLLFLRVLQIVLVIAVLQHIILVMLFVLLIMIIIGQIQQCLHQVVLQLVHSHVYPEIKIQVMYQAVHQLLMLVVIVDIL